MIIFIFTYKKHELITGFIFAIFLDIYESFEKYSKRIKISESSRSISPIKKKIKRSEMAGTTTTKTTFKSESEVYSEPLQTSRIECFYVSS